MKQLKHLSPKNVSKEHKTYPKIIFNNNLLGLGLLKHGNEFSFL